MTTAPEYPVRADLHDAIMRLQCRPPEPDPMALDDSATANYRDGHRDARHAAAELAVVHIAKITTERDAAIAQAVALRAAATLGLSALQSQWSPYRRAGSREVEAMNALRSALAAAPAAEG